jgi:replicative DNA helicase
MPITMSSLKESGGIEYGADLVLGIQHIGVGTEDFNLYKARAKDYWNMELVVLKHRLGKPDVKKSITFYPKYNLFPYEGSVESEAKMEIGQTKLDI